MHGIRDAAVIGVADEIHGESIRAYVSLEKDSDLDEKKIKKYCLSHLENFMIPKEVVFLDELPKLQNQKIDRVRLKTFR
jgi:acyl-coenzyme A synthetase/AMP-(fatty) acid ligase